MEVFLKITATIVMYNENISTLKKTVDSFLLTPIPKKLFLVDNSSTDKLRALFVHPEIVYIFVGKNIGFGAAHNLVLRRLNSEFHLILNPDISFNKNTIVALTDVLKKELSVSFLTPKVLSVHNTLQHVCRKHPTIYNLLNRRLHFSKKELSKNEYRGTCLEKPMYPEFIHGCFMLFKTKDFIDLGGFDERYFLYMEDADLCRKIAESGKKILYYPLITITHEHQRGSSKKIKLFFYHVSSAIKYFLKWGI